MDAEKTVVNVGVIGNAILDFIGRGLENLPREQDNRIWKFTFKNFVGPDNVDKVLATIQDMDILIFGPSAQSLLTNDDYETVARRLASDVLRQARAKIVLLVCYPPLLPPGNYLEDRRRRINEIFQEEAKKTITGAYFASRVAYTKDAVDQLQAPKDSAGHATLDPRNRKFFTRDLMLKAAKLINNYFKRATASRCVNPSTGSNWSTEEEVAIQPNNNTTITQPCLLWCENPARK